MRRAWALAVMMGVVGVMMGQSLPMRRITTEEGLAGRTVASAIQSREGYLWFATTTGLSRFDGNHFYNFTQVNGLPLDDLRQLYEDSKGRIWLYANKGEFAFIEDGAVHNSKTDPWLGSLRFRQIAPPNTILEDRHHRIWIAHSEEYLCLHDTTVRRGNLDPAPGESMGGFGQFLESGTDSIRLIATGQVLTWNGQRFERTASQYVPIDYIFGAERGDSIIFPAPEGLVVQNGANQRILIPAARMPGDFAFAQYDMRGNLLLGLDGGSIWQYPNGRVDAGIEVLSPERGSKAGRFLLEDHEGNLWFTATDNGVLMVLNGLSETIWLDQEAGLRSEQITAVAFDRAGILWFGDHLGNVGTWNKLSGLQYWVDRDPANPRNRALGIVVQPDGEVWVGMRMTAHRYRPGPKGDIAKGFHEVIQFDHWYTDIRPAPGRAASLTGFSDIEVLHFAPTTRDPLRMDSTILMPKYCHTWADDGTIWMGTADGLACWDSTGDRLIHSINARIHSKIQDIEVWQHGILLATNGQGVLMCQGEQIAGSIGTAQGIASNHCRQLAISGDTLWIATEAGLSAVSLLAGGVLSVRNYAETDGLKSLFLDGIAVGSQYVAAYGSAGIALLPRKNNCIGQPYPYLHIDSLMAGGKLWDGNEISWETRDIRIKYTGIACAAPKALHYQYRLVHDGDTTQWVDTKATDLDFQALAAGSHRFELRAANGDGEWSPLISREFPIARPYWQQWWFVVLCIIAGLSFGYLILRWRLGVARRKYRVELEMQATINSLENKAVQAMMNPHFIFNVMNSIRHLMHSRDMEAADMALTRFAKLVRTNLTLVAKPMIALHEEVEFLRDYLAVEALRFGTDFSWAVEVDPQLEEEDVMLPSMVLQPFVENALIHGLQPHRKGGTVQVSFKQVDAQWMEVTIADNGVGMGQGKATIDHQSQGMSLTQERLRILGLITGQAISITVGMANPEDVARPGTKVVVRLPLDFGDHLPLNQ